MFDMQCCVFYTLCRAFTFGIHVLTFFNRIDGKRVMRTYLSFNYFANNIFVVSTFGLRVRKHNPKCTYYIIEYITVIMYYINADRPVDGCTLEFRPLMSCRNN